MNDAAKLIDHAAGKDDRWLMLALLFAAVAGVAFAVRWLAQHVERLEDRHIAERDAILSSYRAERQERFDAMTRQADKLGEIIQENTTVIARNNDLFTTLNHSRP